ncbi:MAG TPA: hypothetical protein VGI70_05840, partial [Polyangiales bacterium]
LGILALASSGDQIVFWAVFPGPDETGYSDVFSVGTDGGTAETVASHLGIDVPPVASDGDNVYWLESGKEIDAARFGGSFDLTSLAGFDDTDTPATSMTVDDTAVYWDQAGTGTIYTTNK